MYVDTVDTEEGLNSKQMLCMSTLLIQLNYSVHLNESLLELDETLSK